MNLSWQQIVNLAGQLAAYGGRSFEDIINELQSRFGVDINSYASESLRNPRGSLLKSIFEYYEDWDPTKRDEDNYDPDYEPEVFADEEIERNLRDFEESQDKDYIGLADGQSSEDGGITLRPRSIDEILNFRVSLENLDEEGRVLINGKRRKLTNMYDYYDLQRELLIDLNNRAAQTGNQQLADETYNFIRNERSGKLLSDKEQIESNELENNFYYFNLQRQKEKEDRELKNPKKQDEDNYLWGPKNANDWKSNGDGTSSFGNGPGVIIQKRIKTILEPLFPTSQDGNAPKPEEQSMTMEDKRKALDKLNKSYSRNFYS